MMTDIGQQEAVAAPYGQACEECAKSKTKCMLTRQGGDCQRCRRLCRECRPAPARRRRRQATRMNGVSTNSSLTASEDAKKTKRLEEKLQEVMTLLKSGAPEAMSESINTSPQTDVDEPHSVSSTSDSPLFGSTDTTFDLSPAEAQEYLDTFVTAKLHYLPVWHVSSDVTSNQLRAQHPFLWLTIMTVSANSGPQQRRLTSALKEHLSQTILRRSERSLDLLLGLLVMLGWNNRSTDMNTKIPLSIVSQLAVALVCDLGLNKAPRSTGPNNLCINPPRLIDLSHIRTMEEQRAALGCFVITSIVSSFLQKTDALRWTSHLSECLSELTARQECSNDNILVAQVKAQLGVEKVNMLRWYDETIETAEILKAPPTLYVQALHAHIAEARSKLPVQPLPKTIASLHLLMAELVINELTLNSLLTSTPPAKLQTLKFLMACLTSVTAWFELFFSIPLIEYTHCGFPLMSQLVQCLQLLYMQTAFEDSHGIGWNTTEVRTSLDIIEVMDRVISNCTQVHSIVDMDTAEGSNYFLLAVQRFSYVRSGWAAALEGRNSHAQSISSSDALWTPREEELVSFEGWNAAWLDDDWSMNFGMPLNGSNG